MAPHQHFFKRVLLLPPLFVLSLRLGNSPAFCPSHPTPLKNSAHFLSPKNLRKTFSSFSSSSSPFFLLCYEARKDAQTEGRTGEERRPVEERNASYINKWVCLLTANLAAGGEGRKERWTLITLDFFLLLPHPRHLVNSSKDMMRCHVVCICHVTFTPYH